MKVLKLRLIVFPDSVFYLGALLALLDKLLSVVTICYHHLHSVLNRFLHLLIDSFTSPVFSKGSFIAPVLSIGSVTSPLVFSIGSFIYPVISISSHYLPSVLNRFLRLSSDLNRPLHLPSFLNRLL